ncbi:MAG: hypothetical protein KDD40_05535 [Bdellovibrionales bacterium]|nr:hypothetical protein [Bdellovibrionales bacterium]
MEVSKKVKEGNSHSFDHNLLEGTNFSSTEEVLGLLENSPINIMYCGTDLVIKYLNPKSVETLQQLEKYLPISVSEIVGSKIDVFHKNPSYQQKILANDRNFPLRSTISVGPEKLDLMVSAIYDQGKYTGAMVTWDIITEKLKKDDELARIESMMENAPINIMCADLNGVIQYMNPASIRTLKEIESDLPCPVDKIVGNTYDQFHKNQANVRKILANESNLPHKAVIKVGKNFLDLLVSPMKNKEGKYIGPMVTWEVVTEKLEIIRTLESTSSQLSASAEELSATATEMARNADKTSAQSNSASANSEEVSKGVQAVATNTEEMAASIKEIAKSSAEASEISKSAMKRAEETNTTITQLGDASLEIGNVIKVISSIAQQTNLLALNATIEAARAGDAGKGFAVVANEVKELAKQTAQATEDITNKINNIQDSSSSAVTAIAGIAKVIEEVNNIAISIAAAVEEQAATTNEVSRVVQESNVGVEGIANTVREVAEAAKQSSEGANQTLDAAKGLANLATSLRDLVERVKN